MADEPTLGEISRGIAELKSQVAKVGEDMRVDRQAAAETFVRRDVYNEQSATKDERLKDLETRQEERDRDSKAFRRQMLFLILAIAIPSIGGLLLSITIFLAIQGSGGTP